MNPTVNSTEEPRSMSCLQQLTPIKKGLIALGVLAGIAVAVILGVTLSNSNNPNPPPQVWTGMCIECQNQACNPGEQGVPIQCPTDTVACINGTGTDFTRRHCGSKDKLSDGLVMNDCVVMVRLDFIPPTDYGHTEAKSLILCDLNLNPKYSFGMRI